MLGGGPLFVIPRDGSGRAPARDPDGTVRGDSRSRFRALAAIDGRGDAPWNVGGANGRTRWYDRPLLSIAFLLLLAVVLFGWRVGDRGLWSAHEGRAAQNAWSMVHDGHWLVPQLFIGMPDYQKPPLYYWLVALVSELRGGLVGSLSVRMPAVVAAAAGLLITWRIGAGMFGARAAMAAAVILACTTRYAWLGRVGRIDMPLALCCLLAFHGFWKAFGPANRAEQRPTMGLMPWFWMALAVLLKGPVGVVLIALPTLTWLALVREPILTPWRREARDLFRRLDLLRGLVLLVAITVPWYAWMAFETRGRFLTEFLLYHNVERALGSSEGLKAGPFWFYLPRLFTDAFPWSLLYPFVGITLWRQRQRLANSDEPASRGMLFCLAWLTTHFLFLSAVSFKRADYLLPLTPAAALMLSGWLADRFDRYELRLAKGPVPNLRRRSRVVLVTSALLVPLAGIGLVAASVYFQRRGLLGKLLSFSLLEGHLNDTDRFMIDGVEDILRANAPILAIGLVATMVCIWFVHTGWHLRQHGRMVGGLAAVWGIGFLIHIHIVLPAIDPAREMSRFGRSIRAVAEDGTTIHYFGKFDADLVFHAGTPARMIFDLEDLLAIDQSGQPGFVVVRPKDYAEVRKNPLLRHWIGVVSNGEDGGQPHRDPRILITNQPARVADRLRDVEVGRGIH
jgi:4-amino-4-deoxy-L-arabinose transferase-like glycosyltransferase